MMNPAPYFLIHRVDLLDGEAAVEGRVGEAELKNGHIFLRTFDRVESWSSGRAEYLSCHAVLVRIEAYGRQLEVLGGGMTGRLRLRGEALHTLSRARLIT
jgi:hypothetical protein